MNFISTVKGSLLENFYPEGWDMQRIDECCEKGTQREEFWNKDFNPVECENINDFDTFMGHEIALQIKQTRDNGQKPTHDPPFVKKSASLAGSALCVSLS